MADSDSAVRQRRGKPGPSTGSAEPFDAEEPATGPSEEEAEPLKRISTKERLQEEDSYSPYVDILRVLTFLLIASCGLSYLISSGESWFWGMKNPPNYLQSAWWKAQWEGPRYLTLEELAAFDGSDETKPLYLAINGTVYDVSANRRTYGPGGSYHWFTGCDASRGFVTGCFAEDRTGDMRGVEEMFLPLDDPEVDKHFTAAEFERMRATERRDAEKRVHDALLHWVEFFKNSKKYHFVGYVKRDKGWPATEKRRKLCDAAAGGRVRRTIPESG